jgi:hypothetical protein
MTSSKLTHKNPKMNSPGMWYRVVGESDEYYFAVIDSKNGNTSTMHAVLKSDYILEKSMDDQIDDLF